MLTVGENQIDVAEQERFYREYLNGWREKERGYVANLDRKRTLARAAQAGADDALDRLNHRSAPSDRHSGFGLEVVEE